MPSDEISTVSELIQERRKYEGWLSALEARAAQTPPHVFQRVKGDYEARLAETIARIAEHTDALAQREETLGARLSEISEVEQRRRDERAEAELRSHVGEMTAEQWDATSGEIDAALATLDEERSAVERDIADLREMLAAAQPPVPAEPSDASQPLGLAGKDIAGVAAPHSTTGEGAEGYAEGAEDRRTPPEPERDEMEIPVASPGSRATPAQGPEAYRPSGGVNLADLPADIPETTGQAIESHDQLELPTGQHAAQPASGSGVDEPSLPPATPSVPPSAPSAVKSSGETKAIPKRDSGFDELAFLKTVTGLGNTDAHRAPAAPPRTSGPSAKPSSSSLRSPVRPSTSFEHEDEGSALSGVEAKSAKTLECGECKAMNYPTEWYCERCGAELAAL